MSSSACVGCSCVPSPAFMTCLSVIWLICSAEPEEGWRMTKASTCIASRFLIVSTMLSPLATLLDEALKLRVIAPRLRAAISKENLVLVEFSKNASTIRFPCSVGMIVLSAFRNRAL